jgi:hypothetical protein
MIMIFVLSKSSARPSPSLALPRMTQGCPGKV